MKKILFALLLLAALGGGALYLLDGERASIPIAEGYGPSPTLPRPDARLIPTVKVADARPFAEGETPVAATGLSVAAFASGLNHPRTLHVLPNGDVLVAESNAPKKPEQKFSIKNYVMKLVMAKGGAGVPSPDRIVLLRDADGDGKAEVALPYIEGVRSPFGMALVGDTLFVAATDAIMAYPYVEGAQRVDAAGVKLVDLPAGPINHHWTKDLVAGPDGRKLYATVGSNSNVGENGIENETNRAAVLEIDIAARSVRLFASGLRNPNGITWNPESGALWVAVNERDEIGSDLVPDYMTSVRDGGFYGWPYSYFGQNVDVRAEPRRPDLVERALVPDYALGPHTASLGLAFYSADLLPAEYRNGAFVGQHGSWNRKPPSGYKVVFVPFKGGKPAGPPKDILTGFLDEAAGVARGRPVGVAVDRTGALLVADDVGNAVWRVTPASAAAAQAPGATR